jgi:hypothetical protein
MTKKFKKNLFAMIAIMAIFGNVAFAVQNAMKIMAIVHIQMTVIRWTYKKVIVK